MKSFWEFVEEREMIRIKKEMGGLNPLTDDEVLRVNHFTNVRREDDRGTKLLFSKIDGLPYNLQIFWTFVYRLSGSNPGILDGNLKEYFVEIPEGKPTFSAKAYSLPCFPKGKGIAMRFLKGWLPANIETLLTEISMMSDVSIDTAATILYTKISEMTGYARMKFHCGEIAKDLSHIVPDIGIDTEVNLGPGCKKGLRKIGVPANQKGIKQLLDSPENIKSELNFSAIEHSACEYGKYVAIHEAGQHRNRVRDPEYKKKSFGESGLNIETNLLKSEAENESN